MVVTKAGPKCDCCGKWIFGLIPEDKVRKVSIKGIKSEIDSCHKCLPILKDIDNWKQLPPGPLRQEFERNSNGDQR